jgi:DNA-binding LacI/PurR family transcriptional regulator
MATRRRPTIHDVAKTAGVSATTVSDALNGKGRVDASTRERVRRVAGDLGYRPSRLARGLQSGRTATLGFMLPHGPAVAGTENFFGIDFYLELAVGAAQAAFAQRHGLTLLPDVVSADELGEFPLDGVIVNDPLVADPRLRGLDELGMAYVTVERALDRPDHTRWVAADTDAGTRAALDHLAERGAERIALLTVSLSWAWLADTDAAYRRWCAGHAREARVVEVAADHDVARLPVVSTELLAALADVDAVFTASDRYAVSVARALSEAGRKIGEDVLLACGVDSRYAQDDALSITALHLQPVALGKAAVELLLSGTDAPKLLMPELRVRASSSRRA